MPVLSPSLPYNGFLTCSVHHCWYSRCRPPRRPQVCQWILLQWFCGSHGLPGQDFKLLIFYSKWAVFRPDNTAKPVDNRVTILRANLFFSSTCGNRESLHFLFIYFFICSSTLQMYFFKRPLNLCIPAVYGVIHACRTFCFSLVMTWVIQYLIIRVCFLLILWLFLALIMQYHLDHLLLVIEIVRTFSCSLPNSFFGTP